MEDGDDIYRFQDVGSDTEMTGVNVEHGYQQASKGKQLLNKDDLYFNDMDIRAWERRTAALGGAPNRNDRGYQEDGGYYEDSGGLMSAAEYEEVLFQRVLDKIRLARAADVPDVQLTPEELDAYQSKLHGTKAPAARPLRSSQSSPLNDTMSVANASTTSKKGSSSSRSKKEQQRLSIFASKPKREKPSSSKRAPSTNAPSAPPPGFMIPGPDGQLVYTPIHASQGDASHNPVMPPHPTPPTASGSDQPPPMPTRHLLSDMPGAFPGALPTSPHLYRSTTPLQETHPSPRDLAPTYDALGINTRASNPSPKGSSTLKAHPVEPYQYHTFSSSSSTQSSPKPRYTRRVSSAESTYTTMPRRVPVPSRPQASFLDASLRPQVAELGIERMPGMAAEDAAAVVGGDAVVEGAKSVREGKRGKEEKRKSGKGRKRH